ncbi:PilW family protein [Acaryochloris marina]|uniref:PilW family protein n=1 Tax=Acaryochloris marina TaxID=155978 RepID=UPI00059F948D|nr:prepilin-type N-terminal cleavage/methylation domain-containing protein [Acaryochloris marina]BDM77342.1 hypothetical protein AM10699_02160 [Acaryochloris marina MBIC10699]
MATKFTKLKLFSPTSNKGFTLVELLVTTLIATVVLVSSLGLISDQRRRFVSDQVRAESNQTLRVGLDLIGADIKNTGDFLETDINLPVVTVIDGASGAPDEIILQRKLISDTLTVCEDVNAGATTTITVAVRPGAGDCPIYSDGNNDDLNDPLTLARRERCEQDDVAGCARNAALAANTCDDECVTAYIYDPVNQEGEFFSYMFEEPDASPNPTLNRIYLGDSATFANTYQLANRPIIYLLEQRHYRLNNNVLQLSVNRGNFVSIVNQVADFQVQAQLTTNPNPQDSFNSNPSVSGDPGVYQQTTPWQTLQFLQVDLQSVDPSESDLTELDADQRQIASRFYPRNARSQD